MEHKKQGMYNAKSIEGWLSPTIKQPVITRRDHASHPNGMSVGYGQDVMAHEERPKPIHKGNHVLGKDFCGVGELVVSQSKNER